MTRRHAAPPLAGRAGAGLQRAARRAKGGFVASFEGGRP